jgi:hypothetical protein
VAINDAANNRLDLFFATPSAGSLVGYAGGPLSTETIAFNGLTAWGLTSGSLTPAPEPPSLVLVLSALAGLGVALRRRAFGLRR